jgi:hypothetical protein
MDQYSLIFARFLSSAVNMLNIRNIAIIGQYAERDTK